MIHAYDDEDNAPMWEDLPLPYPVRTWEEMIRIWEGKHDGKDLDGRETEGTGEKTVTELLTWIEEQICDNYCKYGDVCMSECKDPEDAEQMLYEKYCANCPMSRL